MNPRTVVFRREFHNVFAEKTILLAIVIQVFVAGFSSFLVVGLASLVDPDAVPAGAESRIIVVGLDAGASDSPVRRLAELLHDEGATIHSSETLEFALYELHRGQADGIVEGVPPDDPDGPHTFNVVLPDGDLRSTFTLVKVKGALEAYERELRTDRAERLTASPIYVDAERAGGGSYGFVYGLLIPLLVFLPVVLSGALTADSMTEEMERGTLPLLLSAPASPADVVEGKVLANALLAPLLTLAWVGLLSANGLAVPPIGALWITAGAFAGALILGYLAAAVALLTRDRNKAHLTYALVLFTLLGATLLLPVSPVNAVARLAAGSATPLVLTIVGGVVAVAVLAFAAFRFALNRAGTDGLLTPARSAAM